MPAIQLLINAAVAFWLMLGTVTVPPIDTKFDSHPYMDSPVVPSTATTRGSDNGYRCTITTYPWFYELDSGTEQMVITHEVGHCLGMLHIEGEGIMNPYGSDNIVATAADRAEFYRVHPELTVRTHAFLRTYELFIPAIAK